LLQGGTDAGDHSLAMLTGWQVPLVASKRMYYDDILFPRIRQMVGKTSGVFTGEPFPGLLVRLFPAQGGGNRLLTASISWLIQESDKQLIQRLPTNAEADAGGYYARYSRASSMISESFARLWPRSATWQASIFRSLRHGNMARRYRHRAGNPVCRRCSGMNDPRRLGKARRCGEPCRWAQPTLRPCRGWQVNRKGQRTALPWCRNQPVGSN